MTKLVENCKHGLNKLKELVMKDTNVNSCVWCGVAFLRGHGGTFQPIREMRSCQMNLRANRDVEGFDTSPSH